jgi:hypothetical protein
MNASLFLAGPTSSQPSKHLPHALIPLLKFAHGVPAITGLLLIVLLVFYTVFKLSQIRSA